MPLSRDNIKAIQAWVEGAGCAIGGIHCQGGDLSSQLATVLCEGTDGHPTVNLVYVRTTALETSLLEQDLVQVIPGSEGYVSVWSGEGELPEVALTTYSCLHQYLRSHVGQEKSIFQRPTVVVLEHEIGVWVEGVITRDMLALEAAKLAEDQEGPWVKILGVSYSSSPQEWLQHPMRLSGGADGKLSLHIIVGADNQVDADNLKKAVWDEDDIEACAIEIAHVLKKGLNIVIFSMRARFNALRDAVEDLDAGQFAALTHPFMSWPLVDPTDEVWPVFRQAAADEAQGYMICMPHDGFPCGLPFERVGMTVIMPPGLKLVYSEEQRLCLDSAISLTKAQFMRESGLRGSGLDLAPTTCFIGNTGSFSKRANHLINREDDYLAGWLSVIEIYPDQPIENLPFFGALLWPAYSHDCLTQLSVMGLVENGKGKMGFRLTQNGYNVVSAFSFQTGVSVSGISALADVSFRLQENVARAAVRLILLLEDYRFMVKEVASRGNVTSGEDFRLLLENLAVSSTDGGPGRKHVGRGALWAAWVVFEDAFRGLDLSVGNLERSFRGSEITPESRDCPFKLRVVDSCDYAKDVVFWEEKIGLEPLQRGDWGDFQLSDADADTIQQLLAKSYYPFLLDVPLRLEAEYSLRDSLRPVLHRSGSLVRGSKDLYALYMITWADSVRKQAPSQSSALYAGLAAPPLTLAEIGSQVQGNAVMIMPYETASAVDKDALDTWADRNSAI